MTADGLFTLGLVFLESADCFCVLGVCTTSGFLKFVFRKINHISSDGSFQLLKGSSFSSLFPLVLNLFLLIFQKYFISKKKKKWKQISLEDVFVLF